MPIFIFIIFDSTQHSYTHFFLVSNINLSYERDWKKIWEYILIKKEIWELKPILKRKNHRSLFRKDLFF